MTDSKQKSARLASALKWQVNSYELTQGERKEIKRKYGLSYEDYMAMVISQNGGCAICGGVNKQSDNVDNQRIRRRMFFVDHCHKTGKVRGLLCSKCNSGLGMLGDDAPSLRKALDYLQRLEDK